MMINQMSQKVRKKINPQMIFYGFLAWTVWILFYSLIFNYQVPEVDYWTALFITGIQYYTYAVIGIFIWRICAQIPVERLPKPLLFLVHFVLSILVSTVWLIFIYGGWYLREGDTIFEAHDIWSTMGWQLSFGMTVYLMIAGISYTVIHYNQIREKEKQQAELKLLSRDAELKALKMQINPHFLFNTLNSINALVSQNPKMSRKVLGLLSDLLRMSLDMKDQLTVPLKDELAFMHTYLEIEKVRFGDRLDYNEEIDPNLLAKWVPNIVLQPLLENAVKHGIADFRGKGWIRLLIKKQDKRIAIKMSNSLKGEISSSNGNGTGLSNVKKRLELLYRDEYQFTYGPVKNEYQIELIIPLEIAEYDKRLDY